MLETMAPSLTRMAVRHARRLAEQELAPELRQKAAICLLDHFGCCIGALELPWAGGVLRYLGRSASAPEALQWGLDRPIAATDAAFGNGVLGHGLIQDDMHVPSGAHIGVVILPALLALAQRERLSGRALIAGIVAGYEVMARVGMAVRSGSTNRHFRPSGLSGAYGATAGAVAALCLDESEAVNALGFAANFAAGLNEWPWSGGQEIYVHAGAAARNALVAIDLAVAGMTASESILEGQDGMFAAYGSGPDAARVFQGMLDEPGRSILDIEHKSFPGCNFIQTPVGAALSLRERERLRADDIERITIRTLAAARRYPGCDYAGPFTSVVQAKMSLQYAVAAALGHGRVDEAAFANFEDTTLHRLISACSMETVAAFDACYPSRQPAEVEVTLRDGRILAASLDDVPWLSPEAVQQRFEEQARRRFDADAVQRIKQLVFALWKAPECQPLFDELARQTR